MPWSHRSEIIDTILIPPKLELSHLNVALAKKWEYSANIICLPAPAAESVAEESKTLDQLLTQAEKLIEKSEILKKLHEMFFQISSAWNNYPDSCAKSFYLSICNAMSATHIT
jgi:hypothetical protein